MVKGQQVSPGRSAGDARTQGRQRGVEALALVGWLMNVIGDAADRSVEIVGDYQPRASGFNYLKLGVKPQPASAFR